MMSLEGLISSIGWKFFLLETERLPFSKCFVSLEDQLDFSQMPDGEIVMSNRPGRIEVIGKFIDSALD
eukprot:1316548-Karenia_brevis.AAC.1